MESYKYSETADPLLMRREIDFDQFKYRFVLAKSVSVTSLEIQT